MKEYHRNILLPRSVKLALFVITAVLLCLAFSACGSDFGVGLTRDEITVYIGESRDILPYVIFTPKFGEDKSITLSSDSECVDIDGTNIIGTDTGEASVTVIYHGKTAVMHVAVKYREPSRLTIEADMLYQTVEYNAKPKAVTFIATTSEYVDPQIEIEWNVNGAAVGIGQKFAFTPEGYGEYTVTASVGDFTDVKTVRVYRPTKVDVSVIGSIHQTDGDFSEIIFTAKEEINSLNPPSMYEWTVNGESRGNGAVFAFTPDRADVYIIRLVLNGKARELMGAESITVTAEGERAPNGEIVFDSEKVYAVWNDGQYIVRASVFCPDGKRVNLDSSDAQNAYRFGRGSLDLTEIVDVYSSAPAEYTIRLADEGESEFTFVQYGEEIKPYLEEKLLLNDYFISSAEDAESFVKELYACGKTGVKCYLGRSASDLESIIKRTASDLGLIGIYEKDGSVLSMTFADYCVVPTHDESPTETVRMYSQPPHIEYNQENRRANSYILSIDRSRGGVDVSTTEQLLCVALSGGKPLPVKDSTAEKVYAAMRTVLLSIIGYDYDDWQKIHAIYDWLQWNTVCSDAVDDASSARFIDGVFARLQTSSTTNAAVTSEGMAKSLAVLCRMEGIGCYIARGKNNGAPHYYNVIKLDGLYYNVDAYIGKIGSDELGIARASEFTSHRALLVDNKTLEDLGVTVDNKTFDVFDVSKSAFLQKRLSSDSYFDYFIEKSEIDDTAIKSVVYYAFAAAQYGSVSVPAVGSVATYFIGTLGVEFKLGSGIDASAEQKIYAAIEKAAEDYSIENFGKDLKENAIRVYKVGDIINIVVSLPTAE